MAQHDDLAPYQDRSGPQLNSAAAATLTKNSARRGQVDYQVDCPTCHGTVRVTEYPGGTYRVIEAAEATEPRIDVVLPPPPPAPVVVIPMVCGCGMPHSGAPAGMTGCGSVWYVPA